MGMYNDSIKVTLDGTVQQVTTTSNRSPTCSSLIPRPIGSWKILKDGDSAPGSMATSTASDQLHSRLAPGQTSSLRDSAGIQNTYDPSKIYVKITSNP